MTFKHTSHTSEIGFIANSTTLAGAFIESAKAITAMMTEDAVATKKTVSISLQAESKESLLFDFLDYLILLLDTKQLFISSGDVKIEHANDVWSITGSLQGDKVTNYECHGDVKAPTYHALRVEQLSDGSWELQATVDV